ncbi:hypothetical protein MAPG_05463 [Magnaporthiopsis poae ATCC 64411]|uniref:Uncharacterized protein n=1 Tax=Magnaporthiopsis poae (strain ATCC 64411 / 73-15) TaxID=644358 RepID=A0A0C4DZG3_MAGP6|nr:hypothetical protein MAPG_05463 [Magnaporthiopsis poae ATCC 64411]
MDDDATASQSDLQMEDVGHGGNDRSKGSHKSFKRKYRKMRDHFDRKMRDSEELYRREQKAIDTNKRIAIEIDRLLDMLLDLNNAPQIPPDKRFDLSLPNRPKDMPDEPILPIDRPRRAGVGDDDAPRPGKSFAELLEMVPHHKYAAAALLFPDVVSDLEAGTEGFPGAIIDPSQASHPASFLTADDIDNYLWEVDRRVAQRRRDLDAPALPQLPTLAPKALVALQEASGNNGTAINGATNSRKGERGGDGRSRGAAAAAAAAATDEAMSAASRDFALRNPTSVYNWLRKHAPKTFLQDGEVTADKENGDDGPAHANRGRLPPQDPNSSGRQVALS